MKESRCKTLLLVASWAFFVVVFVGVWVMPAGRQSVTLGQLATKEPPAPLGRVYVSNCVGGIRDGRFMIYKAPVEFRYTVVFAFPNANETPETVFTGYCSGPVDHVVEGIPSDPPYVLVIDCRPVTPAERP